MKLLASLAGISVKARKNAVPPNRICKTRISGKHTFTKIIHKSLPAFGAALGNFYLVWNEVGPT